jgi:cobalt-zinc-cadmium efflux system membrane fusion protein
MKNRLYGIVAGTAALACIAGYAIVNSKSGGSVSPAEPSEPAQQTNSVQLSSEARRLGGLKTAVVRQGRSSSTLLLSGTCEVDRNRIAKVTAPVSGRITRLTVSPGQVVGANAIVAVIESVELADARRNLAEAISSRAQADSQIAVATAKVAAARRKLARQKEFQSSGAFAQKPVEDAQTEVASGENDLRTAESEHERARSELARSQELFKSEIVARRDLEIAQAEERVTRARLKAATQKLDIAQQALSREQTVSRRGLLNRREVGDAETDLRLAAADLAAARVARANSERSISAARENVKVLGASPDGRSGSLDIRAEIGGVVLDREVTLGESVERGAEICEIADTGTVWIIGNAYEKDLSRLRLGQSVAISVTAYPETRFAGRVTQIGTVLDEKSRTVRVRCQVANPGRKIHPGMFAQLVVQEGGKPGAILVPEAAVQEDAGAKYVFVVDGSSYRRALVRLGEASNGTHEVLSGLKAGDVVVTDGSFILKSESKKNEMEGD